MRHRATTILLQIGVVAVVLAALPYKAFELDRYFVPKELVLHVAALVVGVLVVARAWNTGRDAADTLLALFLVWSLASALFATNYWLAQRALAVSLSSIILFWGARQLGAAGHYRPILVAAGFATVCAAYTGLTQAYGLSSDYFSLNRAPGGTFGNRNFVAHFAAIGLPALIYSTVTARRPKGALLGSIGIAMVATLVVLTRSRAAWLAVAASLAVLTFAFYVSRRYWRTDGGRTGKRLARSALAGAIGVGAALVLPNQLNWRSDSPYLESALEIADYSSGSGRGRLAQYVNSMRMVADNPLFGVGPGNWPVRYVRFAPAGDKSLTDEGMTANPWPSSDWVAYVSERGIVAAIALLGAFAVLFMGAFRRWSQLGDSDVVLAKAALAGTIAATGVVSAFDAVLLLAAPAFLAWTVIGAASGAGRAAAEPSPPPKWWKDAAVVVLLITMISVARGAAQWAAISTIGINGTPASWLTAAVLDPGSYRIALRAAELQAARGRCGVARAHAQRARDLFPHAGAPRRILRSCG